MRSSSRSNFDGGVLGYIGTSFVVVLIMMFTLGIGTPWAICYQQRWIASHTVIDGQRLVFTGKGLDLLLTSLKWMLLTIVTFGIYSFWLPIKSQQWLTMHTHTL